MMSTAHLLALGGVILLGAMSPGPDFVNVTRSAALSGRRAGVASAAGVGAGVFVWSVGTALGVAGLLAASAVAFTVVKLAGAAYLVLLGVRALLAARRGDYHPGGTSGPSVRRPAVAFRQGLLTNLLNPKVAVFYVALVPQFLPADPGVLDTVVLGAVAATVSLAWYVVLVTVVGALRRLFSRLPVRRAIDAVMGGLLIGLGARIALQSN
jgi:threonine/homoserine/homoserine lactone efflux protein